MADAETSLVAGALLRRPIRRACMTLGLTHREEKGWLDSLFVIRGPQDRVQQLVDWLRQVGD